MATTPIRAGYIRVSSARQRDQSDSPASQRQRLQAAGCTHIYEDLAVSGYRLDQRRKAIGFQRLIADITAGRVASIHAVRIDRVARRDQIVIELAELCQNHGVPFSTLTGGAVNVTTASGWLQLKIQSIFGEHYSRALAESIRGGYQGLHAQGIPARSAASLPFHLEREPGTRHGVRPSPHWPRARHAVERIMAAAWTPSQAGRYLMETCGRRWESGDVRRWLKRPAIAGHLANGEGEILVRDCWPALVSAGEHQQLLAMLEATKGVRRVPTNPPGLLSGVCRCAACGSRMAYERVKRPAGTYVYLRCRGMECGRRGVRAAPVWDQLLALLDQRLDELVHRRAVDAGATEEPAEVMAWRRELQARGSLPAEMQQPADRRRITELQGLIHAAEQVPTLAVDWWPGGQAVGSVGFWTQRPEAEINADLRRVIEAVYVDPASGEVKKTGWRNG